MKYTDWLGLLLGGAGFILFGATAGWLPALGLFLVLWGNNLQFGERR